MIPRLLVLLQFSGILLVLLSGNIFPLDLPEILFASIGVSLGLWAILEQRPGNFNIAPTNKKGARLVQSGPYKYIRHPMYLAILFTLAPIVIVHFNWIRLALAVILLIVLIIKLEYEERQLVRHFPEYGNYKNNSWKLLPFVY